MKIIKGNKLLFKIGNKITNFGNNLINKSKENIITNANAKLFNPFTLIINFTINNTDKYQVLFEGDYKTHYKDAGEDNVPNIPEDTLYELIVSNKSKWFKKE